jgi:biopolymer transport protein ExbD
MKVALTKNEDPDIQVAPLIDMVFLLLVYFMASASLARPEADLGIRLPGMLSQAQSVELPDEQMVEVRASGHVALNGREYDSPDSVDLPQLLATLIRYRQSAEASRNEPMITIAAEDESKHQRVIDVMNACAAAGIKNVSFQPSGE